MNEISQKKSVTNEKSKLSSSKFTKSLTSFLPTKNKTQQNTNKKSFLNNISKTKKVYFSGKKQNNLGYLITNPLSPLNNYKFKGIYNNNPIRTTKIPNSAQRVFEYKNGFILNNINNFHTNIIINSNNNNRKENKCSSLNEKKNKK